MLFDEGTVYKETKKDKLNWHDKVTQCKHYIKDKQFTEKWTENIQFRIFLPFLTVVAKPKIYKVIRIDIYIQSVILFELGYIFKSSHVIAYA